MLQVNYIKKNYIYIYKILFNPENLEEGIIPIRTNKIFKNRILNSDIPGKELNVSCWI